MAASRSSCANCRRMFNPDSRASMTSLAPVGCNVRDVASRCSASSINVILHDGISPFGVAIAPEYCTDAIFILTEGDFFGDAAGGGASFPICCDTLPTRSPSSCFVMYDPRLPLFLLQPLDTPDEHLLKARAALPPDCRDCKSGHPAVNRIRRSPLLHAGGLGGPAQPLATCRRRR